MACLDIQTSQLTLLNFFQNHFSSLEIGLGLGGQKVAASAKITEKNEEHHLATLYLTSECILDSA